MRSPTSSGCSRLRWPVADHLVAIATLIAIVDPSHRGPGRYAGRSRYCSCGQPFRSTVCGRIKPGRLRAPCEAPALGKAGLAWRNRIAAQPQVMDFRRPRQHQHRSVIAPLFKPPRSPHGSRTSRSVRGLRCVPPGVVASLRGGRRRGRLRTRTRPCGGRPPLRAPSTTTTSVLDSWNSGRRNLRSARAFASFDEASQERDPRTPPRHGAARRNPTTRVRRSRCSDLFVEDALMFTPSRVCRARSAPIARLPGPMRLPAPTCQSDRS